MQSAILLQKDWKNTFDHISRAEKTQRMQLAILRDSAHHGAKLEMAFQGIGYDPKSGALSIPSDAINYLIIQPVEVSIAYSATDIVRTEIAARDGTRYRITFLPPLHLPDLLLTFAPIAS